MVMKPPGRDGFVEFCLEQLEGLERVRSRRMFGGHGIYAGGVFFAIIYRGRLYLKSDETTRALHEERGMRAFEPTPGQVLRSYYEVPPEVIERRRELAEWARRAIACQERALRARAVKSPGLRSPGSPRARPPAR
jgi:DNA transformation protein and related proteins